MKKLTTSVLAVVLSSSFAMVSAQQKKPDTLKIQDIEEVFVQPVTGKLKVKDEVTSSQQIIGGQQLNQASNPNAISALAGKASGVRINQTTTSVNSSQSIQIRSPRTITGSNEALVVIDNVPSTADVLSQLPTDVIDNINIVKGAAGAAVYGPAGVNGVIIVTTKQGSAKGKVSVTWNSSADFEAVGALPQRQKEYGQGWDGYKVNVENGAWGPAYNSSVGGSYLPYGASFVDVNGDGVIDVNPYDDTPTADDAGAVHSYYSPFSNNVRDFFQTGTLFQNSLTINSGDRNGYFSATLGSLEREFVVQDDKLSRYSALFKAGASVGKWKLDGQFNFIRRKTSETSSTIYHDLLQASSDIPITAFEAYPDRAYAWNIYYGNPYYSIKHNRYNNLSNYFNVIGSATYSFNNHINFTYRGNLNFTNAIGSSYNDGWVGGDLYQGNMTDVQSFYTETSKNTTNYYGDLLLNFNYDLTDDLNMDLTLGHNYKETNIKNNEIGGTGIIIPGLYQTWNLSNPYQPSTLNNTSSRYNSHAFFSILDLDYKKYLFLNAVARYELASVLRNIDYDNNFSYFYPAVSASFVPTKAFDFGGSVLNYMKVTAAWQRTGGVSSIAAYDLAQTAQVATGYPYISSLSFVAGTTAFEPNLKPEFNTKKEIGLTLGFLNDRITFDGSVYQEDTDDLITQKSASRASGVSSVWGNIGSIRAKGLEMNLNFTPIKSQSVKWDVGVNYSTGYTEVKSLADGADEIALINYSYVGLYAVKGEKFPVIKGTTYVRDDQGRVVVDATTGLPQVNSTMSVLGQVTPKYILGFNTSLKVKNFTLSATMDYRTGHKFYSGTLNSYTFSGQNPASAGFDRTSPYIVPNSSYLQNGAYVSNTNLPIYATTYNNPNGASYNPVTGLESYFGGSLYNSVGENFVLDASAFKVREIALSYTFDKKVLFGTGIEDLTFGVHVRNPFSVYSKENKNYDDPEAGYGGNGSYVGLVSYSANQYPMTRFFGASLSAKF